jgi:tRNA(Ile)-lysidine synthase
MSPLTDSWEDANFQDLLNDDQRKRIVVAFSGGADSTCLLHMAVCSNTESSLVALHINHGLHPDADDWQRHCVALCETLGVDIVCHKVNVKKSGSVEENARRARYAVFTEFLAESDLMLMAHHADDQTETVLFNLFRGNAAVGVLGMPKQRKLGDSTLYRPLLSVPKSDLRQYCVDQKLSWIEDDSNLDTSQDRSFLRHRLIPVIRERWASIESTLKQAVQRDVDARGLLDEVAREDFALASCKQGLSVSRLCEMSGSRQQLVFVHWLRSRGLPFPSGKMLASMSSDLLMAAQDASPVVSWHGYQLRRFRDVICLSKQQDSALQPRAITTQQLSEHVSLGQGLSVRRVQGGGIRESAVAIRFRAGDESMRLRAVNRKLKKIFQENAVPPWLRNSLPLIYVGDRLAALPGIAAWDVQPVSGELDRVSADETGLEFWFTDPA